MFIAKLLDSSQEAAETQSWLDFALQCGYIEKETVDSLDNKYEQIFAMLSTMERKANSFCD